jgi:radical SAM protein with 4Fe4S-binding SPASM domain
MLELTEPEQLFREAFGGQLPILRSRLYVTLACNLRCPHCYVDAGQPLLNELSFDELCSTVDYLESQGLLYLTITGGEPLLRKEVTLNLARYASKKGMIIRINTNGTLISEEIAKELSKIPNLHVNVSVDGFDARTHEMIRGEGTFAKVLQGIKMLRKEGVKVAISSIAWKENIRHLEDVVKLALNLGVQELRFPVLIPLGRCARAQELIPDENELKDAGMRISNIALKVRSKLTISIDLPPALLSEELLSIPEYEFLKYGCFVGITRLDIYPDGTIFPCDSLRHIKLGNIGIVKDRLGELWNNSEELKKIREVYRNLKGVCRKCVYRTTCHGHCRAMAYLAYGDLSAPNPICQKLYEKGLFPKSYLKD